MRTWVERALRGVVLASLAFMLWLSAREQPHTSARSVSVTDIGVSTLHDWSASSEAPRAIRVQPTRVPTATERAWLAALAGSGSAVSWSGALPAMMAEAAPIASPLPEIRIDLAAPAGSSAVLRDELGAIDTLHLQSGGTSLSLPSASGSFAAEVRGSVACVTPRDSLILRRVLVIGAAGWESKFVVAALEEEGWKVDALLRAAPGVEVLQGPIASIDTSRYSAVIALDGAVSPYANRIVEFVRAGGGVVLEPDAASLDALAPLRAGSVTRASLATAMVAPSGSIGLASLPVRPLVSLRSDAVTLDRRGQAVVMAARRVGAGRALQLGYDETWRWRMAGGEQSLRDHRAWWTERVASVAYAPSTPRGTAITSDEAPLASLVTAIGPAVPTSALTDLNGSSSSPIPLLFALLALALIAEIASRRLRGAS